MGDLTPWAFHFAGAGLAMVLALIACQPIYARLIWRDIGRARRRGRISGLSRRQPSSATSAWQRPTTLDALVLLVLAFAAIAFALKPTLPVAILWGAAAVLIVLAVLDLRYFWLPDRLTLPLGVAGFLASLPGPDLMLDSGLGAAIAGASFYGIQRGFKALRGIDGLGSGDIKLLAALGAWTGAYALPWLVLAASVTALIMALPVAMAAPQGRQPTRIPFGLHLALAGWLCICLKYSSLNPF